MTESVGTIQFKQQALNQILQEACQEGQFAAAVLASLEGFLIAAASPAPTGDAEIVAAMVAYLRDAAQRARTQLGLSPLDELVIRDQDNHLVVCRSVAVDDKNTLILMVLAPGRQAYRRLTNIAIQRICTTWQSGP